MSSSLQLSMSPCRAEHAQRCRILGGWHFTGGNTAPFPRRCVTTWLPVHRPRTHLYLLDLVEQLRRALQLPLRAQLLHNVAYLWRKHSPHLPDGQQGKRRHAEEGDQPLGVGCTSSTVRRPRIPCGHVSGSVSPGRGFCFRLEPLAPMPPCFYAPPRPVARRPRLCGCALPATQRMFQTPDPQPLLAKLASSKYRNELATGSVRGRSPCAREIRAKTPRSQPYIPKNGALQR